MIDPDCAGSLVVEEIHSETAILMMLKRLLTIRRITILGVVIAAPLLFVILFQNTIMVQIGCSAYNVKVIGVAVPEYQARSVNIFGNNYTTFQVGPDDGPDMIFDTGKSNQGRQRHHLGYATSGSLDRYYIPC
uniref:hypothetical protein n=1 Tax=Sphingomonas bacterium TaxID=1895847 RepID=UPI0026328C2E|nr:hypothetical protein [Sphingomonas bacterium]